METGENYVAALHNILQLNTMGKYYAATAILGFGA